MTKNQTSFKPGNKAALGCTTSGRPRKYDYPKEGKELYEWSKLPTSTAVYQFTRDKEYLADELDEFSDRCPEFALYYKKAKENIGQNREEMCNAGTMNYGVWAKSACRYHSGLHKFERAEKEFDATVRANAEAKAKATYTSDQLQGLDYFMKFLEKNQSSALNNAESNIKSEEKS